MGTGVSNNLKLWSVDFLEWQLFDLIYNKQQYLLKIRRLFAEKINFSYKHGQMATKFDFFFKIHEIYIDINWA